MESSKHMKSNSGSSEESDHHQEQVKDDAGSTAKRSYECTYCKRGFTNAQALGGHMNIHRKDRAKAKQNPNSSVSKTPNEDYMMSSRSYFRPMISGEHANYYHPSMVSCPTYHPPPQPLYNEGDFSSHRSSNIFNLDDTRVGANLSLRIGSSYMDHREVIMRVDDQENDDVDLELRLGPDP